MSLGNIDWGTAAFQLVAFLVLLYFVSKFALKPLMGIMETREQQVNNQIDSAEQKMKEAEAFVSEQRKELEQARAEAQKIVEQAKKLSEQQSQDIIEQARENAERVKNSALAEIQREKEQAVQSLREQVASLSVLIAAKVIEKELDAKGQEKLVEEYLNELGEGQL